MCPADVSRSTAAIAGNPSDIGEMRLIGNRLWYSSSLVLGLTAIVFDIAGKQSAAKAMAGMAKVTQARADGVAQEVLAVMREQATDAAHRAGVLGAVGLLAALCSAVCLAISSEKQEAGWKIFAMLLLIAYGMLSLLTV